MSAAFRGLGLKPAATLPPNVPYVAGTQAAQIRRWNESRHRQSRKVVSNGIKRAVRSEDEESDERDDSDYIVRRGVRYSSSTGSPKYSRSDVPIPPTSSAPDCGDTTIGDPLRSDSGSLFRSASYDSFGRSSSGPVTASRLQQLLAVSRDDAFKIMTTTYLFRSNAPELNRGPVPRLDPDTQVFGCEALKTRLKRCINIVTAPESLRAPVMIQEPHVLWHTSPFGSGTRTFVESFCAKNRINLMVAYTHNPRNPHDFVLELPFVKGQYASMVEEAIRISPCILFMDRLDPHFEINYESAGHELVGTWDAYEERCNQVGVPVPPVWILISTAYSLGSTTNRACINPLPRLHQYETCSEGLGVRECATILCDNYMHRACKASIFSYDVPSRVTFAGIPSSSEEPSDYEAHLKTISPVMLQIATKLHFVAHQNNFTVKGAWLAALVRTAFETAIHRVNGSGATSASTTATHDSAQLARFLPTTTELFSAAKSLPFDVFRAIVFEDMA